MEFLLTTRPVLKDGIKTPVDVYAPIRDEIMRLLDNGRRSVFVIRNISKKPRSF